METSKNQAAEALKAPMQKDWLNPNETHKEYGFSVSTLAKWRMDNKYLPFSKIGKYIKYKRADIEAFLNSNVIDAVA
ncbi:MAG: DNA-binding protein [Sulfurimonas sp.]|nr:MAG: DNA-binding protein [Sulfurimonas sp.]